MRRAVSLPPVTVSEFDGVRYLHLGSVWVQGAMRIRKPQQVVLDYVQRMLASLLWLPGESLGQGQAVQLGLGAGAITRFTARQLGMATTVVEINPEETRLTGTVTDVHIPGIASAAVVSTPSTRASRGSLRKIRGGGAASGQQSTGASSTDPPPSCGSGMGTTSKGPEKNGRHVAAASVPGSRALKTTVGVRTTPGR